MSNEMSETNIILEKIYRFLMKNYGLFKNADSFFLEKSKNIITQELLCKG